MPKVYKLINPNNNITYYVGYTEKSLQERLCGHLYEQKQKTTKDLIAKGLKPIIECIEEGDEITKDLETYWIQRLTNQGVYLENRDKVINYQNKDYLYELPTELLNTVNLTEAERYKAAINLVLEEMPLSVSVPILIRIKAILEWAVAKDISKIK